MQNRVWILIIGCAMCGGCRDCNPTSPSDAAFKRSHEIWVAPNLASKDLLNLFLMPDDWARARSRITTIGLSDGQLRSEPCDLCGPNILPNFIGIVPGGAFRWLRAHGLKLAIGAGAVKEWDCTATINSIFAQEAIRNVNSNGGKVAFLEMDEPFTSGLPRCGYTTEETARIVKNYIDRVKEADPAVEVGLVEPYPFFRISQIEQQIMAVANVGVQLPFFHLDFDPNIPNFDFNTDIKEIQSFCRQHNIPFGVIMIGADGNSSAAAVTGAVSMASMLSTIVGIRSQDHVLFASWLDVPAARGQRDLRFYPDNLPESSPATMMGLVNFVLDALP